MGILHATANDGDGFDRDWTPCTCQARHGDPADYCDACRWDYECWLDRLAAEADELAAVREAEDFAFNAYAGWTLEQLTSPDVWHN